MKFLKLILLFTSTFVFSQSGEILYNVKSLKKAEGKHKTRIEDINEEYKLMSFTLNYDKTKSSFIQNKNFPKNALQHKVASILIGMKYTWFQDVERNQSFINAEVKEDVYQVIGKSKMDKNQWQLFNETKKIDGFTCYKASRKELNDRTNNYVELIAWYTPDIPVPYGPIGEGGLPGLILQLNKGNFFVYTAEKVVLNPKKNKIKQPIEAKVISTKEYLKLKRKARKVTPD